MEQGHLGVVVDRTTASLSGDQAVVTEHRERDFRIKGKAFYGVDVKQKEEDDSINYDGTEGRTNDNDKNR